MQIALIADAFPPMRSSAAVQLRDLSGEFARQGHSIVVMIPSSELTHSWQIDEYGSVKILRLRAPKTKDINYIRRTIGECLMPFFMLHNLKKSPFSEFRWDGIIWYAPSIFLGPMISALKKKTGARSYLILRDIFPEWAVDMGLLSRGLAYKFFKQIERYQYSVANVIGVQTQANLAYFDKSRPQINTQIEVLQNWLAESKNTGCSITINNSSLSGRKIFVYAGNMGVAQGLDIFIELAERLSHQKDIGFLFVGRGSEVQRLASLVAAKKMDNVLFHDEIDSTEIPGLYSQCSVGIVALDPRHKTHNIPGKFLSYMQSGIPALASINPGNDLEPLIKTNRVGRVCSNQSVETLYQLVQELVSDLNDDAGLYNRCREMANSLFSTQTAVEQIIAGLTNNN